MNQSTAGNDSGQNHHRHRLCDLPVRRLIPELWPQIAVKAGFRVGDFANLLQCSRRRLLRECQKRLQCSVKELLTHLQMLAGLELVLETDHGKDVADQLGFANATCFTRRFKAYFGLTPWEMVHKHRYHKLKLPRDLELCQDATPGSPSSEKD
jgi:AraC-like DNA-binding protein